MKAGTESTQEHVHSNQQTKLGKADEERTTLHKEILEKDLRHYCGGDTYLAGKNIAILMCVISQKFVILEYSSGTQQEVANIFCRSKQRAYGSTWRHVISDTITQYRAGLYLNHATKTEEQNVYIMDPNCLRECTRAMVSNIDAGLRLSGQW